MWGIDVVVPNDKALVEGDWNNLFPFGDSGSTHYQQVYDASQFRLLGTNGGTIQYIGFRYHGNYNTTPMTYYSMAVRLSTTSNAVDNLSSTFVENVGVDSAVVFSGRYILGVTPPPADHQLHPWPFPMFIQFTVPFYYNPTNGNLLLDIQWPYAVLSGGNGPPWPDEVETTGDPVSRLHAENIYETYIPTNGTANTYGLVTMFGVTPAVPSAVRINNVSVLGTNLVLTGSGGAPGVVYCVLAGTNLASSVNSWIPVATNVFDASGTFACTNAVDGGLTQRFYVLQLQ
jgi:hypothetical protein